MASNQSTAARAKFHLPFEITIEILSRLPVKSLLRFKSVCKNWYDLIKTPDFISKHHLQTHSTFNSTSLLVTNYNHVPATCQMSLLSIDGLNNGPINLDFPFLNGMINKYTGMNWFYIVGICNGLVCIHFSPREFPLILCNPSTRQFQEIPNSEWLDEMIERVSFGFGFHPSANDFKLIRIVHYYFEKAVTRADLYVMSTRTWTKIDANKLSVFFGEINEWGKYDTIVQIGESSASAVLNGVFYWLARVIPANEVIVMSFDMGDEVFRKIKTPVPSDRCFEEDFMALVGLADEKIWRFTELNDKLALVIRSDKGCLDIWLLNEDKSSWTNQFKVGSFPRIARNVGSQGIAEITGVGGVKNGELVVADHKTSGDLVLFSYDLMTLETKDLYFGRVPYPSDIHLYSGTLLPVK